MSNLHSNILPKRHISIAVKEAADYIRGRMDGTIQSVRTKFPVMDSKMMGGIETNSILTISARSGHGKTVMASAILDQMDGGNMDVRGYFYSFEMASSRVVGRSVSKIEKTSLNKLYSVEKQLEEEEYQQLKNTMVSLAEKDMYFIDVPGSPEQVCESIYHYWKTECKDKGIVSVNVIDHALLCTGDKNDTLRISQLMYGLVKVKKQIISEGGYFIAIVLSQMNRDNLSFERLSNPQFHRPKVSDLFASSTIEMCSDYILFVTIPKKLGLNSYTENEFPAKYSIAGQEYMMAYIDIVKNRDNDADICIPLLNKLSTFDFDEMSRETFMDLWQKSKSGVSAPQLMLQTNLL